MKAIAHFFKHFEYDKAFVTEDGMIFGNENHAAAHAANLDSKKRSVKTYERDSAEVQKALAAYEEEEKASTLKLVPNEGAEELAELKLKAEAQVEEEFKDSKLEGEELEKAKAAAAKKLLTKLKKEAGL